VAATSGARAVRRIRLLDFSIRAWRDGKELGSLARAAPVGRH
jgi:hypothetical protein